MMNLQNIDKLTTRFRQFGGQLINAEVRYSQELGVHCHTLDKTKNSVVSCPASLLVDIKDIGINKYGAYIAEPKKYGNRIYFLKDYFAFHFNQDVIARHISRKKQIDALSVNELSLISKLYSPSLLNVKKFNHMEYERTCFLHSHNIWHRNKYVIMPFVSLINYHRDGPTYNVRDNNISVSGKFNSEIHVKYNNDDALQLANAYHFITDTQYAYSLPINYKMKNGKKIIVNHNTNDVIHMDYGMVKPTVKIQQDSITLSYFPLFKQDSPNYPEKVATMLANETNIPSKDLVRDILKHNLQILTPAASELKLSNNTFARFVGDVAQRQLDLISGSRQ